MDDVSSSLRSSERDGLRDCSWYAYVETLVARMIPAFGLSECGPLITGAYGIVCRESLAGRVGRSYRNLSRINEDGTPFQFSLTLGHFKSPFQFLSEAGVLGSSTAERLARSKTTIGRLAKLFQIEDPVIEHRDLFDEILPSANALLMADPAGALWIGASFDHRDGPSLRLYCNGKWGSPQARWARCAKFADYLGAAQLWRDLESSASAMEPLGMALTVNAARAPTGRIYLSAYGKSLAYYEEVLRSFADQDLCRLLRAYAVITLGDDCQYPIRSTVLSFGLRPGADPDVKFELCSHCAFSDDLQAKNRCLRWLEWLGVDPTLYVTVLTLISDHGLSERACRVHCYAGFGRKQATTYSTLYLKPSVDV